MTSTLDSGGQTLTGARRFGVLIALCLAVLVLGLDTTVLNVALPTLAKDLEASTSQLQWMANSYNLVLAALLLPAGLLGDRYGRRKIIAIALSLFGLASLACALADSAGQLIAARAFLGIGAAMIVPVALSLITVLFRTAEERKKAIGFFVVANSIGMPLGPIVGGLLLDHAGWQWIFVINIPIAFLAALAVTLLVPESRSANRPAIDWLGMILSSAGLAALVYGVTKAGEASWGDTVTIVFLVLAVVLIAGFLLWQRRTSEPLIELRLFSERVFTGGAVLLTVSVFAIFGLLFTMPQYFQGINGSDALHTGLKLLPFIGGMTVGAKLAEPVEAKAGTRLVVMSGFVVMAAGFVLGAFTDLETGYGYTATWFAVVGFGLGCSMPQAMNAALGVLDPERAGTGSGLLQAFRQVGGTVGVAVLGTVLNSVYRNNVDTAALPAQAADAVEKSLAGGLAVAEKAGSPELLDNVRDAFLNSLNTTMWVSAGIAAAGAILAAVLMPARAEKPSQDALMGVKQDT
ncbi:EmrB/QacA subfamily drug resistance transporter [Kribbella sp. VKM Ac-2571]|uniref:DHA2 family efflux MFS transporter permease subunit n=1 Tax=Kribbella sp. VKM Ac-2571 TaxID=2512222 RepID=UPI00105B4ED0|nr:DHA2 family efflux MFS transporter permease subunit [Kribbella sp. VKM Ac-2571]TDO55513.1 EmrB/QacA subfamily drug resistance transporter [Kribbella sp. VKM Ac-2571]